MTDDELLSFPELRFIPDQTVMSGSKVEINFFDFALREKGHNVEFSIVDFPEGFIIEPKAGVVTGIAPVTELNQTFVVKLILTNLDTRNFVQAIFRLEVIGSLLLETPEGKAFFGQEELNFWDSVKTWELRLFIQQLIAEHFAWVMLYDAANSSNLGQLQSRRIAGTGWEIINFDNAVMITPGNKAFEQYGNRRRILDTLREVCRADMAEKSWGKVLLDGSDIESIGKAWIIAKELDIPVDEVAPSDAAEINFYNLNRIYEGKTPSKRKPQLGS